MSLIFIVPTLMVISSGLYFFNKPSTVQIIHFEKDPSIEDILEDDPEDIPEESNISDKEFKSKDVSSVGTESKKGTEGKGGNSFGSGGKGCKSGLSFDEDLKKTIELKNKGLKKTQVVQKYEPCNPFKDELMHAVNKRSLSQSFF